MTEFLWWVATILSEIGSSKVIITPMISFGKEVPTMDHDYYNLSHGNKWVYEYLGLYNQGDETHVEEIATENQNSSTEHCKAWHKERKHPE